MTQTKSFKTIEDLMTRIEENTAWEENEPNKFKFKKTDNLVAKEFSDRSYNGPCTQDFIDRLNMLFDTAQTDHPDKSAELEKARQSALDKINDTCQITPVYNIKDLEDNEPVVLKAIKTARRCLQEFVYDALRITRPDAFNNHKTLRAALATFEKSESSLTSIRGRPHFVNFYPVPSGEASITQASINRVVEEKILPSTARYGQEEKLPNFIEFGTGYMDGKNYISQFKGYRHTSYTPIKMIDQTWGDSNVKLLFGNRKKLLTAINQIKFERRKVAANAAKDMFAELARHKINEKEPIELELSSLAMLSPIKGDKLFLGKGESEHRQLKESYNALMMYNNRETTVTVDGKEIKVIPRINIMNTASNWHGIKASRYMQSDLERNINAEGMNKYITDVENYLKISPPDSITGYLREQVKDKQELSGLYEQLESFLNKKENAFNDPKYIELLKSIASCREKIYWYEQKILQERMYLLESKRDEMQTQFASGQSGQDEITELFYQSLFIYKDKKAEPAQFGARYLLVNEKMGKSVDFFCKSGEDRTGRMQNLIEELCIFSHSKGHFPRYDFKKKTMHGGDEKIQREIALIVSERSVSRENSGANAIGARALQTTSALQLNKGLLNQSGKALAKLAKTVYDINVIKKLFLYENVKKAIKSAASSAWKARFFHEAGMTTPEQEKPGINPKREGK